MLSWPRWLVGVLGALLSAQSTHAVCVLEAYQQAAASDPQLRAAAATRSAQLEAKPQARALLLPSLSSSAVADRNHFDRTLGDSNFTSRSLSISLSQPLYNRGNQVQQRLADATVGQADSDFESVGQLLILRVAERYFNVLSAQDDLTFVRADKDATARQLEQAKQRFEVGLITITDVLEAQARFDNATSTEIFAINNVEDAKEALREVTGEYYDVLQPLEAKLPLKQPQPADVENWLELAVQNNPSLQSAAFSVEGARENINLQKSGHYPTLDLTASYSDSDNGSTDTRGGRIGLQLFIPIYEGGAVVSRSREAAFQYEAAKENREELLRAILRQVRDAYRGVDEAISQVKALDQARTSNRSALDATQAGFEVGTRTIVDVLDAQRDVFSAERDYAQARYAYVLNNLRLRQAVGQLYESDLQAINKQLKGCR